MTRAIRETPLHRVTLALLPRVRVWDGTTVIDPYSSESIATAVAEYAKANSIQRVRVQAEPCKPKSVLTICVPKDDAADVLAKAIEWTAKDGDVALLMPLTNLGSPTFSAIPRDVFVIPKAIMSSTSWDDAGTFHSLAWFVYGRNRKNHRSVLDVKG